MILDMYRETIEHPWSIPEPIKKHLDLTSGHDRGRLYELLPDGFRRRPRLPLSQAANLELVSLLADNDAWWRETAQRLLIERGLDDLETGPMLHKMARTDRRPLGRVHALWTLDSLGELQWDDVLPAFEHEEPRVREQAARLSERFVKADPSRVGPLAALADDPDAMVRFQAAFSLGEATGEASLKALAKIAARDAGNRWIRVAVLSSVAGRVVPFADALAGAGLFDRPEGRAWLGDLAQLVGAENQPAAVAAFLARFAGPKSDARTARALVLGLGQGLRRTGGSLRGLLNSPAHETLVPLFEQAGDTARGDGSVASRVEAVRLLGLGPVDAAIHVLPALLDARQPGEVQLAALQALATIPDERIGVELVAQVAVAHSLAPS